MPQVYKKLWKERYFERQMLGYRVVCPIEPSEPPYYIADCRIQGRLGLKIHAWFFPSKIFNRPWKTHPRAVVLNTSNLSMECLITGPLESVGTLGLGPSNSWYILSRVADVVTIHDNLLTQRRPMQMIKFHVKIFLMQTTSNYLWASEVFKNKRF